MINLQKAIVVLRGDFNPTEKKLGFLLTVIIGLRLIEPEWGLVTSASFS